MFTRLFSLLTTDIFIPNYLNVLDRENDKIIKCQILVEIIIIEDNIFHLLWRICVISFISIIYRFQTKWLPRRRSRTRSPLVCIYISLTGKYLTTNNSSTDSGACTYKLKSSGLAFWGCAERTNPQSSKRLRIVFFHICSSCECRGING